MKMPTTKIKRSFDYAAIIIVAYLPVVSPNHDYIKFL